MGVHSLGDLNGTCNGDPQCHQWMHPNVLVGLRVYRPRSARGLLERITLPCPATVREHLPSAGFTACVRHHSVQAPPCISSWSIVESTRWSCT
jgi:hypothetical protein